MGERRGRVSLTAGARCPDPGQQGVGEGASTGPSAFCARHEQTPRRLLGPLRAHPHHRICTRSPSQKSRGNTHGASEGTRLLRGSGVTGPGCSLGGQAGLLGVTGGGSCPSPLGEGGVPSTGRRRGRRLPRAPSPLDAGVELSSKSFPHNGFHPLNVFAGDISDTRECSGSPVNSTSAVLFS